MSSLAEMGDFAGEPEMTRWASVRDSSRANRANGSRAWTVGDDLLRREAPDDKVALHFHEALFYRDQHEYIEGLKRFLAPAVAAGEPVAVAVPKAKLAIAREVLAGINDREVLDMEELGRNPGRIIPAVERMLLKHEGRTLHYVGEPIWPGRSPDEIREAVRHEALINRAWPSARVRVLCPYDALALDPEVLESAARTHPTIVSRGERSRSSSYHSAPPGACDREVPPPPTDAVKLELDAEALPAVRALAAEFGQADGLARGRLEDLLIVTNELASNALQHGQPPRRLTMWRAAGKIMCEVQNRGAIGDPLAGRRCPRPGSDVGMGLWIVHQLCDLVEVRTGTSTTVRAHFASG